MNIFNISELISQKESSDLYVSVSVAFVPILRQLLGREEEEALKLTYVSISGTKQLSSQPSSYCSWSELSARRGWKDSHQNNSSHDKEKKILTMCDDG